jgi:hypothetical protein
LQFNVTYDAVIYSIENAISSFNISHGQQAYWELNYSLDQGLYTNWVLKNFSFEIPINWTVDSNYLFDSNGTDLSLNGTHTYNEELNYYWVDFETIIAYSEDGNYTLNCYSLNYIYEMDSFLHYDNGEDYRWKTKAIMPGDNMSVNLIIQNFANQDSVVSNGNAVCELFDLDGNKVNYATLTDLTVGDNATGSNGQYLSIYEFDGLDILNTTESTEKGAYNLVFKWSNGEEVGYDIWPVYITGFIADIDSISVTGASYDEDEMINLLQAYIYKNSTDIEKFNPYIFSLNETIADYIPLNPAFSEEIGMEFNESGVWLNITSFTMNETLINPGEGINIDITAKSFNNYFGNYYKLGITFVQSINEEWQVMSQNSTEFFINETGGQEDEKNINFVFDVPNDARGINAPLRQNPFKINITLWIKRGDKFIDLGDFQIGSAFPYVNYTENELEGIILDYVHSEKSTSANPAELYLKELSRSETILPGTTKYLLQLVDEYYVSTITTDAYDFDSKLISAISDIENSEINWGKDFDLSGYLVDEKGNPIVDKSVELYFMGISSWEVFNQAEEASNQLLTDENGYFTGTFSSTVISKSSSLEVNLTWDAESETDYEAVSIAQTLNFIQFNSSVSITLINTTDNPHLTKGFVNNFQFNIINSGNSTLTDISITIAIEGISSNIDFDFKNDSDWNFLEYNETVSILANVFIPTSYQGGELLITLNVSGKSHESAESYNSNFGFSMVLLDYSSDNFNIGIVVIMLLGIIGVWTAGFFYSKRIYGKLQVVPESKTKKKKRRRYIDVSKLSKGKKTEEGKKIETEATEDVSEQDPRTADLDELLKEEGLDESKE